MWVQSPGEEIPWRRKWQPTPVFLLGKSYGPRSLAGYIPWGCRVGHDWARAQTARTVFITASSTFVVSKGPQPLHLPSWHPAQLPKCLPSPFLLPTSATVACLSFFFPWGLQLPGLAFFGQTLSWCFRDKKQKLADNLPPELPTSVFFAPWGSSQRSKAGLLKGAC